jgi:hypothetical protein
VISGSCPGTGTCVGPYAPSYRRGAFVPVPGPERHDMQIKCLIDQVQSPLPHTPCFLYPSHDPSGYEPPCLLLHLPSSSVAFFCIPLLPLLTARQLTGLKMRMLTEALHTCPKP